MDPLPIWWSNHDPEKVKQYPIHAITQRPAAMYHSWGSQNVWLRQIHGSNKLFVSESIWKEKNFEDGDWARLTSENSSIVVPVALMKRAKRKYSMDMECNWQKKRILGFR